MKLALMQPYFFPYLPYFQLVDSVDIFVCYDSAHFIKQGWINRNYILSSNGPLLLSIPIKNMSSFKTIFETEISYEQDWVSKMLKTLSNSYSKAPYFIETLSLVEKVLQKRPSSIADLTYDSISSTASYLNLSTKIIPSTEDFGLYQKSAEEKVIEVCKKFSATDYHNSIGGKELYQKSSFTKENIRLHFIQSENISYKQKKDHFVPNLSILDALMFNSKEQVRSFLSKRSLV